MDSENVITGLVAAASGGGLAGVLARYKLGKLRVTEVDGRRVDTDAFRVAMKAQLQLNDATARHLDTLQRNLERAEARVDVLEQEAHAKDMQILKLESENVRLNTEVERLLGEVQRLRDDRRA